MSVRKQWPFSRYDGWVKVDPSPYTDDERQRIRKGTPVVLVGFTFLAMTHDWPLTLLAMSITGVFTSIYHR